MQRPTCGDKKMGKRRISIEHNLYGYELEDALEKALRGVQQSHEKPLPNNYLNSLAQEAKRIFSRQMTMAMDRIEKVIEAKSH